MKADDFRDYIFSLLFMHYISDNYEIAAKKDLWRIYPDGGVDALGVPTALDEINKVRLG